MPKTIAELDAQNEITLVALSKFNPGDRVYNRLEKLHGVFDSPNLGHSSPSCWVRYYRFNVDEWLLDKSGYPTSPINLEICKESCHCLVGSPDGKEVLNLPDSPIPLELPSSSSLPSIQEKSLADTTPTFPSTTTLELLTQSLEILMSLRDRLPVSHFLPPDSNEEPPTTEICSPNSSDCYAEFDQDGRLLKMYQDCSISMLDGTSEEYSGNLPRAGMMCSGKLYPQAKWEESTPVKGSGLLPTPKAQDGIHPGVQAHKKGQTLHLSAAVQRMPLATPTACDWKIPRTPTNGGRNLNYEVGATGNKKLNPIFVERLMGFQENETALMTTCLEAPTSRNGFLEPQIQIPSPTEKNDSSAWVMPLSPTKPPSSGEGLQELSIDEECDRHDLERKVENAFVVAGNALRQLRDKKLYRSTHKTFEEYCKERFGFKRSHCYQLIDASGVVDNLSANGGQILPTTERQVRNLVKLKPDEQNKVWAEAVEKANGKAPTGAAVKGIVERMKEKTFVPPVSQGENSVGDIVFIKASKTSTLRKFDGCWGVISDITKIFYHITIGAKNEIIVTKGDEMKRVDLGEKDKEDIQSVNERVKNLAMRDDLDPFYRAGLEVMQTRIVWTELQLQALTYLEEVYGINVKMEV